MEITGKITKVGNYQEGQKRDGSGMWRKQEYFLQYGQGNYPNEFCFEVWGDKIEEYKLQEGEVVTLSFDLQSRVYNDKAYTSVKAWKVERANDQQHAPSATQEAQVFPTRAPQPEPATATDEGLPF